MNKVVIFSDSTCDLSLELVQEKDIKVIPLYCSFTEETYLDGVTLDSEGLFLKVEEKGYLPKTSACGPNEFIDAFKPYLDEGCDIFYCGIGSNLSSAYQSVLIAAEELGEDRVFITDSKNLSTGIGLLLLKACKYRDQGMSAKQIKEKVDNVVPRVKTQFVIKTLDYLHKGGRCSTMAAIIGKTLRIRPMIVVRDGTLRVGKKTIGLFSKAIDNMTNFFLKDEPGMDHDFLFVTYSSRSDQSRDQIDEIFKEKGIFDKVRNIYHTTAGCVISSHCGPGCIGILYIVKDSNFNEDGLDEDME